jgi:Skp family chaperone for outer membrane proteins
LRTRIAVVNVVQVLKKYSKYMTTQSEFQKQSQAAKEALDPLEKQIRALQAKGQLPETPPAERDNIKRDLEHLQIQYRDKAEDADKQLAKRAGDLSVQFYKEVEEAIEVFAKSNAIELVLMYNDASKSNPAEYYNPGMVNRRMTIVSAFMPIYVDQRMDITDAIAQMLNRRVASGYGASGSH